MRPTTTTTTQRCVSCLMNLCDSKYMFCCCCYCCKPRCPACASMYVQYTMSNKQVNVFFVCVCFVSRSNALLCTFLIILKVRNLHSIWSNVTQITSFVSIPITFSVPEAKLKNFLLLFSHWVMRFLLLLDFGDDRLMWKLCFCGKLLFFMLFSGVVVEFLIPGAKLT